METMLRGVAQRPLVRSPVDRRHSIAKMAARAPRCLVPELMPCWLVRFDVESRVRKENQFNILMFTYY